MRPENIYEDIDIVAFLTKRGLLEQYKKSKKNILSGENTKTYFKERQPRGSGIWYFRINKQFRALGRYEGENLIIFMIDNHQ